MDRKHFWLVPVVLFVVVLALRSRDGSGARIAVAGTSSTLTSSTAVVPGFASNELTSSSGPSDAPPPLADPVSPEAVPTVIPTLPVPAPTEEPPLLVPELAPPTPAPTLTPTVVASQPVRLVIPAIGLDAMPVPVGLDEQKVPIVPKHDVAWFTLSAMPGQNSNVVFWGHVLRWKSAPKIPAPFARVHELQPGAEIIVVDADGHERRYRVTQQIQARPDEGHYIDPTPTERVTLVSCIGDKMIVDGTLTKEFRLVTVAEPAE